jgi:hypothetical protein
MPQDTEQIAAPLVRPYFNVCSRRDPGKAKLLHCFNEEHATDIDIYFLPDDYH